jgi:hypothetical protein
MGVGTIFYHHQVMQVGYFHDCIPICHLSAKVNWDDSFRFGCNSSLDSSKIDGGYIKIDLNDDRNSAGLHDS